jgi:hypothetical protein
MYNPFDKPADELTESDLLAMLPGKTEGWMFEYKQAEKLSDTKGLAKSIASFANSHGGWLFIGIEADDTNEPMLEPIQGIPGNEAQLTERIYQMSQSRLSPPPYLNVAAVGLDNGGSVLVVHVPESPNPPHIAMSEGKVYVRSGDTTETISDRRDLDRLYDKARANCETVSELLAAHDNGRVFLEEALKACATGALPDVGAFAFVTYPTVRLPSLWDFSGRLDPASETTTDAFNQGDEIARNWLHRLGRGNTSLKWYDHHRCQVVVGGLSPFYIDRFGHLGFATTVAANHDLMGSVKRTTVRRCVEDILGFASVAEWVYRDRCYFGQVGFSVRLLLPQSNYRPPIEFSTTAARLSDGVREREGELRRDLERLAGLQDNPCNP